MASDAWREVMAYEERLAALTSPTGVPGGVARVGAVTAAVAAGLRQDADRLAAQYSAQEFFPPERLAAIKQAFLDHQQSMARRF
jgi:hypothetical protein